MSRLLVTRKVIEKMAQKRIVVVLGMHRSGTSTMTRALRVLGVELGESLLPPKGDNTKGFWEDADVNALNIDLLAALGRDWHSLTPVAEAELMAPAIDAYRLRAVQLLRGKLDGHKVFGLKDPRMARLLPFWQSVFALVQVQAHYVIACRNPLSVAESLVKRDGLAREKVHQLWLEHTVASFWGTQGAPRVVVDYDLLMDAPARELQRMADALDLPFDSQHSDVLAYQDSFLEGSLRHTRFSAGDIRLDHAASSMVQRLYPVMLDLATDRCGVNDQAVRDLFAGLADGLIQSSPLLRYADACVQSLAVRDQRLGELDQYVVSQDEDIAGLGAQLESVSAELSGLGGRLEHLGAELAARDQQLKCVRAELTDKERLLDDLRIELAGKDQYLSALQGELQSLLRSNSWQLTAPLRWPRLEQRRLQARVARLKLFIRSHGGLRMLIQKALSVYRREGLTGLKWRLQRGQNNSNIVVQSTAGAVEVGRNDYAEWVRRYDTLSDEGRQRIGEHVAGMVSPPLISVVMPTYNPNPAWLEEAVASVRNQLYPHWQLCIADDASTDLEVRPLLERLAREDDRIRVVFRPANGHISAASNSALELATGAWVALLDHDDVLSEHALYHVARAIMDNPGVSLIYSDEDKIDAEGLRSGPYFKTNWNEDLFYSHNMICHLGVYKRSLLQQVGGFRLGYEGAQDYDLALRCIEQIDRKAIHHIPRILYHWRVHAGSTAGDADAKPYAMLAGERAINEHFERMGFAGRVTLTGYGYRATYDLPVELPKVSIVIPTRNGLSLVRQCVESIIDKTEYKSYEILIVDNGSDDQDAVKYFESLSANGTAIVIRDDREFNYSALNNLAVRHATGEIVCLLNNDIEVITPAWLCEMVAHVVRPGVGAVGAKLLYPNDTLQHAGVVCGIGGWAGHSHKGFPRSSAGYSGRTGLTSNFSAVTGACLLMRKSLYVDLGGLNEQHLKVACNDVDLCLRALEAGYRNVWTPYAELYHHESATRGYEDSPEKQARFAAEVRYMVERWGDMLLVDPYYSPNLTLDHEDFSLAWPPRVSALA